MTEIIEHIDSLLKEECSRLEIIESLISEFGSEYPDYDYSKWREIVKTRIEETKGNIDDEDGYTSIPQINVISIKEKYDKALNKANNLLKWEERKSRSIRYWSLDSINRWVNHYQGCQQLFSSLEDDFTGNMISVDLYQQSKTYLSQLNSIYSKIPQETLFKCKSLVPKGSSDYRLSSRYLHLPINVQRRFAVAMPRQRKDLRNFISLSASEKDYHTYSDLYLEQILRIPYLTKADENKYFEQYLKGDENAKDAIVESYLPTIYNIAQKYVAQSPDIDIQDLIGEGVYALCKAIPYYNPSSPARLITFAIHSIRGAMYEYVLHNRIVHLPSNQIISLKKIQAAYDRFEQENERRPSTEELAWVLNEYVDRVADTLKMSGESVSLEGNEDLICTENEDSPFYKLHQESLSHEIDRALEQLTPREADILRSYFGIGVPEKTLEEIGMEQDLTRERVRQIKEKAVRKLKTSSRSGILSLFMGEKNFYELSPGSRLCADSPIVQTSVKQKKTCANGQNIVESTQTLAKSSGQESLKYASNSAVSRLNNLERARKKREEIARLKLENEKNEIEKQIKYLIRNYLNTLPLPDQETKKYSYVNRIVAETRQVCSLMSRWIPIWLQLQEKELFRTENNKDILTHLEQNLLVIEKSSIAPDKTIAELCRSISMLQEHISSECAEPDGCRKDSIAIQMKIPKKETGENTKIILTKEIIKSARTANGGLTKHQLEAIGVAWPPTKGAVDKKIGTEITQEQLQQFMTVKYVEKKT